MSRREGRDSDSKRHRSRFDRETSPKRSRWDGEPATERVPGRNNSDTEGHIDQHKTHHRRLQDALPLEAPSAAATKAETGSLTKESDKKPNGLHEKTKLSSQVPRSRSFFQHDERGAGQVDRSYDRGEATERDWQRDSRNRKNERAAEKRETYGTRDRDEKSQTKGAENNVWHHDGFFKLEADPPAPARKRRAFREEKITLDSENADKTAVESVKMNRTDRTERREERGRNSHYSDRVEKPSNGDRFPNRGEAERGGYPYRQRHGGNGGGGGGRGDFRGRDRFDGRQEYRSSGTGGDKWKHDLFQDANRSPTPKDEEDQIAKVEAILASS
ncbi:hypothetical protein ACOSP7_005028 [Xanthoceras sorbifolium]